MGYNIIEIMAKDVAGNANNIYISFTIDETPPHLSIINPSTNETLVNTPRYVIQGTTSLFLGYNNYQRTAKEVLLDGETYSMVLGDGDVLIRHDIVMDDTGRFAIPIDLVEGRNVFNIEARDAAGNTKMASVVIFLDIEPPDLTVILEPTRTEDGRILATEPVLTVSGQTEPLSFLTVNGIQVRLSENGTFSLDFDLIRGDLFTVVVASQDAAGNSRTLTYEVFPESRGAPHETDPGVPPVWVYLGLVLVLCLILILILAVKGWASNFSKDGRG